MKKNENFLKVVVVSNDLKLNGYFNDNNLSYAIEVIPQSTLIQIAKGSFPYFQLLKKNKVIFEWNNNQFNYEVLDLLSKD